MAIDAGAAGAIAAAVTVPLAMRALARIFPARATAAEVQLSLEELQARYRRWELLLGLSMVPIAVPLGFAVWLGLRAVASAHLQEVEILTREDL